MVNSLLKICMCSIPLNKGNKHKNIRYFLFCYRFTKRRQSAFRCCDRDYGCDCIYQYLVTYCYKHYKSEPWVVVENHMDVKVYSQFLMQRQINFYAITDRVVIYKQRVTNGTIFWLKMLLAISFTSIVI